VGPTAGLDVMTETKILVPAEKGTPSSLATAKICFLHYYCVLCNVRILEPDLVTFCKKQGML
jgi:hypothetical protein